MIHFCFDHVINANRLIIWPNLVTVPADLTVDILREQQAPFVDYTRILDYLRDEQVAHQVHDINS
jgi:hypothetical protein